MPDTIKTDNSYLSDKVALRLDHLPSQKTIRVLDCYAGKGTIWAAVKKLSKKTIKVLPIEIRQDEDDDLLFHLPGDNIKFLEALDLNRFDVIDLDAYSVPYDQLCSLFRQGYTGVVFVTFIQAIFGQMPHGLLGEIGFTPAQIEKTPSLMGKRSWLYFLEFLGLHGILKVWIRQHLNKHYLAFSCAAESATGSGSLPEDTSASPS